MNSDPIKILITGDFCPHNRIEDLVFQKDFKSVFNDFIDVFSGNDLNITDLECPLTISETGRRKTGPHQKANPACIELLEFAGIGLAALANNHIMDFGSAGAEETIELCRQKGIATVGVGNNIATGRLPFITSIRGKQIAVINVADQEFLTATDGPFQANPIDPVCTYADIRSAREKCDYVILIAHAGNEFYHLPSPRTKSLYRFFIDAGADAVISNHTHCFSGYEVYHDCPIFYGLGNFVYDWPGRTNSEWNKGYIVRLELDEKICFEIIPLKQGNDIPGVFQLNDREKDEFGQVLESRNRLIADDVKLAQEFDSYIATVSRMYDAYIEPYFGKIYTALRHRGLLPNLLSRKKRLLLLNLTRCEAHREVLVKMLKEYE
jgi:poly-gamma-glutamate capsule biosynthesis protein CapA/YwtB (metallophosphatase superfamily)